MEWLKIKRSNLIKFYLLCWVFISLFLTNGSITTFQNSENYSNSLNTFIHEMANLSSFNAYLSTVFIFLILFESFKIDQVILKSEYVNFVKLSLLKINCNKFLTYFTVFPIVYLIQVFYQLITKEFYTIQVITVILIFYLKYLVNMFFYILQIFLLFKIFSYQGDKVSLIFVFSFLLTFIFIQGYHYLPLNYYVNSLSFRTAVSKYSIFDINKFIIPDYYNLGYTIFLTSLFYLKNAYDKREKFEYKR